MKNILYILISLGFMTCNIKTSPYSPNGIITKRQQDSIVSNLNYELYENRDSSWVYNLDNPASIKGKIVKFNKTIDKRLVDDDEYIDCFYEWKTNTCEYSGDIYYMLLVSHIPPKLINGYYAKCFILTDKGFGDIRLVKVFELNNGSTQDLYKARNLFWQVINHKKLEEPNEKTSLFEINKFYNDKIK